MLFAMTCMHTRKSSVDAIRQTVAFLHCTQVAKHNGFVVTSLVTRSLRVENLIFSCLTQPPGIQPSDRKDVAIIKGLPNFRGTVLRDHSTDSDDQGLVRKRLSYIVRKK